MQDTMNEIGQRLKLAREAAGLTQAEMGERLTVVKEDGIRRQSVGGYEKGESVIGAEALVVWCRETGANPLWVLTGEGPELWEDARQSNWLDGARTVGQAVVKSLRDALGPEIAERLLRDPDVGGDGPDKGVPPDLTVNPNGDSG